MDLANIFDFLRDLKQNNNREWFQKNKGDYLAAKTKFEQFIDLIIPKLKEFDRSINHISSKDCIYRIYRDVRFSKDKAPYKIHFDAFIAEGGKKSIKAGYYVHLSPGASMIGGGIYRPQADILKAIRTEIYYSPNDFKKIIENKQFKSYFKEIYGEKLKTSPKGFQKDFTDIDLLRYKSYAVVYSTGDKFWFKPVVIDNIVEIFKIQSRFNAFLNEAIETRIDDFDSKSSVMV